MARVLPFPARRGRPLHLSTAEATAAAAEFLDRKHRSDEYRDEILADAETVFSIARLLYEKRDSCPASVSSDAAELYTWLARPECSVGYFDEHDYLLGEFALIAGGAFRQLGRREESFRWFERAEAGFRHTLNPAPKLAEVAYSRLALKYDVRQFSEVLELIPSLLKSYRKMGMAKEFAKTEFLRGMTLKAMERTEAAQRCFEELSAALRSVPDSPLSGHVLVEIGALCASGGRYDEALDNYQRAFALLSRGDNPIFLAHLKATVGETLVLKGAFEKGVAAYHEAIADYKALDMGTQAAYLGIVTAETLVQAGRWREAEWEILNALPTIDEQRMVPEGFAAIALLRESVRQRKTDPNALREVREHLQVNR